MSSPYSTMRWRSNGRQLKVWSHVAKESLSINAIGRPITSIINLEFPSPTKWESCKYKTYKKSLPRLRFPIRDYSPRWPQDSWIFIGQALLVVVIVNPSCGASWTIIGLIIYHSMQQYFCYRWEYEEEWPSNRKQIKRLYLTRLFMCNFPFCFS